MRYGKQIRVSNDIGMLGVSIYMLDFMPDGRYVIEPTGEFKRKKIEPDTAFHTKPILFLEDDMARELWEELDKIFGNEKSETASRELSATKLHLADMQTIAFHKLGLRKE